MNVAGSPGVPVKGTVYGAPPGRHAQLDASGEEGVGNVNDRAAEPERVDRPGQGAEPPKPGTRAFNEAETDSWILPGEPDRGSQPGHVRPQPRPWHETGRAPQERSANPAQDIPRSPAYAGTGSSEEPSRPGPVALEEDNWDGEPDDSQASEYAGRRRGATSMRTLLGIAAAIIVLGAAVGLPFLLHTSSPAQPAGEAAGIGAPDNNGDLPAPAPSATSPAGQLGNPASGAPVPSAGPSNTAEALQVLASALAAQGQGGGDGGGQIPGIPGLPGVPVPTTTTAPGQQPGPPAPPPTTTTAPAAPQPPAKFPTTTIQAESGTLSGGATVRGTAMCGGAVVAGPVGSVTMTIPGSVPTSGTYRVQVFYNNPSIFIQTGTVSANGGSGQSFSVGFSNCPASAGTFNVTLHAGTGNKITISGTGFIFALNIDRIVVSQP
jgi:hypothetical protein